MKKWIDINKELPLYDVEVKIKPFAETIEIWEKGLKLEKNRHKAPIPDVIYALLFKSSPCDSPLLRKSRWMITRGHWKGFYVGEELISHWEKETFKPINSRFEILDI